ncbi:hypothetical protein CMI37_06195 [Candidatus Pacearchaeota archaeon]|nr:hypothetical protein [Candidatus Pacearchaeota archaeon]|tara:strand:- start:2556 stop:3029 length:474 start_codon:yes stop_codon:yes gene_type:complete
MAGEKYIDLAVVKLASYINTNLPTYLRVVESAQSMTADSLTDPLEVIQYRAPFDNRSPLVEVFDEGWRFLDHINKLVSVDCTVAISYLSDANLAGGEQFMRRYATALLDTILADTTLGATVVAAIPTDGSSAVARGDNAMTRHIFTQGFDVHVFEGG